MSEPENQSHDPTPGDDEWGFVQEENQEPSEDQELEALRDQLQHVEQELKSLQIQAGQLRSDIEKAKQQNQSTKEMVHDYIVKEKNLSEKDTQLRQKANMDKVANSKAIDREILLRQELEEQLQTKTKISAKLQEELVALKKKMEARQQQVRQQLAETQERCRLAEEKLATQHESLKADLSKQIENITSQLNQVRNETQKLQKQNSEKEQEYEGLLKQKEELQETLGALDKKNVSLTRQYDILLAKTSEDKLLYLAEQISQIQAEIKNDARVFSVEKQQLLNEAAQTSQEIVEKRRQLEQKQTSIKALLAEKAEQERMDARLQDQIRQLQQQLEETNQAQKIDDLQRVVYTQREQIEKLKRIKTPQLQGISAANFRCIAPVQLGRSKPTAEAPRARSQFKQPPAGMVARGLPKFD